MEERQKAEIMEDEIELMDYLKVIWRYKIWIVGVTLLFSFSAFGFSMLSSKVYEVSTWIEPGRYKDKGDHAISYLDTPQNLKAKILQGSYDIRIIKRLNLLANRIGWRISLKNNTHTVKVSLETAKPEQGVAILKELISILKQEYSKIQESIKNTFTQLISQRQEEIFKIERGTQRLRQSHNISLAKIDEEIKRLKWALDVNLAKMDEEIKTNQKEIKMLEARQAELTKEEANVRENTKILMAERHNVMKTGSHKDPLGLLLYTNTLQQNITYANRLLDELKEIHSTIEKRQTTIAKTKLEQKNKKGQTQAQIEKLKLDQKNLKQETSVKIAELKSDIQKAQAEIANLELSKNSITPIQVIQEPAIGPIPLKTKKGRNTAIAGVLGLFISIFGAFFVQYIKSYKEKK